MIIAFDTETELIRPDCLAPRLVCVTFDDGTILRWDEARPRVDEILRGEVVGHNVAYDLGVLCAQWPDLLPVVFEAYREGRVHDTKIRQQLIDIANGEFRFRIVDGKAERVNYHLADLSLRLLGEYVSKGEDTWRLRYGELRDVPLSEWPSDAVGYAVKDAVITRRVFDAQEAHRAFLVDEAAQCRAAWWLHLAACWGMRVDPRKTDDLEKAVQGEFGEIQQRLLEAGLVRREKKGFVRNTKAAAARMIAACEELERPPRLTATGGVCLDEEACDDSGDELLSDYARYSALGNVISKDLPALKGGRIHANFNSLVASGRTSCRGFNLQNMRKGGGTRECFSPPPGFVYLACDLDVAELRAVAQLCLWLIGESRLAEAINSGTDPHCLLAATILGRAYDEVRSLHKQGDKEIGEERQLAKHANFGLWGGMGVAKFGQLVHHMTRRTYEPSRLAAVRSAWLATWPEAGKYLNLHAELAKAGPVTIEQSVSGRVRAGLRFSEACNTRFQGLVADAAKAAGFALSEEMYIGDGVLRGSRLVNFAHDEFVAEVPEELGHECAIAARDIILREVGRYMPDVPPATTPILSRVWSKEAKQVKEGERIVPWEKAA